MEDPERFYRSGVKRELFNVQSSEFSSARLKVTRQIDNQDRKGAQRTCHFDQREKSSFCGYAQKISRFARNDTTRSFIVFLNTER